MVPDLRKGASGAERMSLQLHRSVASLPKAQCCTASQVLPAESLRSLLPQGPYPPASGASALLQQRSAANTKTQASTPAWPVWL